MENIFPFMDPQEFEVIESNFPMAKEWAWDFKHLDFKLKDGKMYIVEGIEAIRIWIWKLFETQRYRELIYSWDYGNELESLIGKNYTQGLTNSEAERYIKEAIEYNLVGYVTGVKDMVTTFEGSLLAIVFTAVTLYGEVEINV